jgi:hypothetical protein
MSKKKTKNKGVIHFFKTMKFPVLLGYIGVGFLISAQWTIIPIFYILGFTGVLCQTLYRRQWNLALLQVNGLIAWTYHFFE